MLTAAVTASVNTEAFQVELLKLVLSLVMLEEVIQVKRFCLFFREKTWSPPHLKEWAWMRGAERGVGGSHADPDPGSGAFLTPGSGMGKKSGSGSGMNNPGQIFES
jgi:hypothetical protein